MVTSVPVVLISIGSLWGRLITRLTPGLPCARVIVPSVSITRKTILIVASTCSYEDPLSLEPFGSELEPKLSVVVIRTRIGFVCRHRQEHLHHRAGTFTHKSQRAVTIPGNHETRHNFDSRSDWMSIVGRLRRATGM